jgi:diguanylate cyclase (GGDEF)-like protein/PAS domain S-box-containing protein
MPIAGIVVFAVFAVLVCVGGRRLVGLSRALDRTRGDSDRVRMQQSVMNDAAVALARVEDLAMAATVAVQAAVDLLGDPSAWSMFWATSPAGAPALAAAGTAPADIQQPIDTDVPGQAVLAVLVDDDTRGTLVVHGAGVEDAAPALRMLCGLTGVAVQRAEATEQRLARHERRFRTLVQNSSDAVTLLGADGVVRFQSANGHAVLGYDVDDLLGKTFEALTHPDDAALSRAMFIKVVEDGPDARVSYECRFLHADGSWRQLETIMTNLLRDPDVGAIVSNTRDVTDRRALETQLSHQAFHDSLTGLANRALFGDRVAHALDRTDRQAHPVAVLFVDIDDFKVVNDSLGHHFGDGVLVAVAERLKASIRTGDTVARIGGDEFAVLLESGEMPAASEVVSRRIAANLLAPIRVGAEDVAIRASIGIALGLPPDDQPDSLLRDADLAMYLAKRNGKGRFEMFHPAMHEDAVRRLDTAADLRRGIEDGQLELYYQPITDVRTRCTIGAEALVRWHHPTRGLVLPAEFIPVAESTGLIVPLGRWVLAESCRQVQDWHRKGIIGDGFSISVNLSARQLQDPDLLGDVAGALRDSGLSAADVVLEVTETIVMEDLETSYIRLLALKDLGLRLAIDDFGTGYSSLSYLQNLPVDIVKIDKSFIDKILIDGEGEAIVRGVIDLSAALGLVTVAEGVEDAGQFAILEKLGCDSVQGYLFAKPMPSSKFMGYFTRGALSTTPSPGVSE